jgi:hypothetical protein
MMAPLACYADEIFRFSRTFSNENGKSEKKLAADQEIKRMPSWFISFIHSFINVCRALGWALASSSVS